MKAKYLTIIILLFISITSCKKYLDVKSDSSLTVPTTIEDLQAILDYTNNMNFYTVGYGEASADNYFLLESSYNSRGEKDRTAYTWLPSVTTYNSDWARAYLAIYNANLCIEQIEKVPQSSTNAVEWSNVKGSALFFRAYHFLQLVWTYSKAFDSATSTTDLGIMLRLTSDQNVASVRSNLQECYDRILSDSKEAIKLLPTLPLIASRPSKSASYGLLARTYLSMRQYDSALKYSDLSLQIQKDLLDFNITSEVNINATVPFKQFNKETVFLSRMSNGYSLINPSTALIDSVLFASYHDDDLRKKAFFSPRVGYQRFKGSYTGQQFIHFSGISTGEMFLTRAECHARTGNKEAALTDLNTLLVKRWKKTVPYPTITASSSEEALAKSLIERRKDLLFRGLRWMDIKRLNKEGANITLKRFINNQIITLPANDKRFALPLPADIIQMTGVPQN